MIRPGHNPDIKVAGQITLTPEVETVLRAMFPTFSQVAVETEFGRGFSGSRAFRVRLVENEGRTRLPALVKIAPAGLIRKEWQAYQRWVRHTLPNIARLEGEPTLPADGLWGGLRYALVGGGTFAVQSLHDYYRQTSADNLRWVLENRLFKIMGPNWWQDNRVNRTFQMQTDYDHLLPINLLLKPVSAGARSSGARVIRPGPQLFATSVTAGQPVELQAFVVTRVDPESRQVTLNLPEAAAAEMTASYRVRLDEVSDLASYEVGQSIDAWPGVVISTRHDFLTDQVRQALGDSVDLSLSRLSFAGQRLPNPLRRYRQLLQEFVTVRTSTIHGDLNLENILIDPETREISLIDFATVRPGHALHDLLRLETEVWITLIPPILANTGLSLETIYHLFCSLPELIDRPARLGSLQALYPALAKPLALLAVIRHMARQCLFDLEDWTEYYQGLTLYLLGALKIKNLWALPVAPLPAQVAFWGAAAAQQLVEADPRPSPLEAAKTPPLSSGFNPPPPAFQAVETTPELESPYGTMHPQSTFYIERAADEQCQAHLSRSRAATLFIQAPRQMGKSSLMRRALHQAGQQQAKPAAFVDFQKFPDDHFEDEDQFLIEFCYQLGDSLGLPEAIEQYWSGSRTNIVKCSRYLTQHIAPQVGRPFILAMDEVERILTSAFRANFFGMLRTWHNDRAYDSNFAQITLFLSSSTEPYLFVDNPNQSPFNVAEVLSLQDFSRAEVVELNRRYGSPLTAGQLEELMALVDGHPFLSRLALYRLATNQLDWKTLQAQATADDGPFGDHLGHYLRRVLNQPDLKRALTEICQQQNYDQNRLYYRLKGAGLIKQAGEQVIFRNNLYTRYFEERLDV